MTCVPGVTAFAWACLEAAPMDPGFCEKIPPSHKDRAVDRWARKSCRENGRPDDEICVLVMNVVPGYCESQSMP